MYPNLMQNYQSYPVANPYTNPQVNAVKIDINNPQAYGGKNGEGQINPTAPVNAGPYAYPYNPVYNVPAVSSYLTPNAYPQPLLTAVPQQQAAANVIPEVSNPAQTIIPAVVPQVAQVAPQPAVVPVPVAVPPVPAVPQAAPAINAPVSQNVNIVPATEPKAIVDTKNVKPADAKPVEPVPPVQAQTADASVDVNGIVNALSSNNIDEQTAAIQRIAEVAQTNPVAAKGLLNEQVFGKLVNIINADTSKLEGPKGAPDPKNLSPLEKAEINKQFAVYTLAILQKNFREEINGLMKKNNLPDIAINDIPFIKEGIVNNLKDNQNPTIREACLSALNYIGRPEDKEVLKVLYDISAKHDASEAVRKTANDYLTKLPA